MAQNNKQDNSAGEVEETSGTVSTAYPSPRMLRVIRLMEQEATMDDGDFTALEADFMGIWEAETKEAMYEADQRDPLNFKSLAGCEVEILNVEVKFSRRDDITTMFITPEGKHMYLWVTAVRIRKTGDEKRNVNLPKIGEVFSLNTSARFAVPKLLWLYVHGEVDPSQGRTEKLKVKGTDLGAGQEVIKLVPIKA